MLRIMGLRLRQFAALLFIGVGLSFPAVQNSNTQSREIPFARFKFTPPKHQQHSGPNDILCNVCEIPEQTLLFTDSMAWHSFWKTYQCTAPEVEFDKKTVAATFFGRKPAGYNVEVEKIIYDPEKSLTIVQGVKYVPDPERAYPANVVCPQEVIIFPSMSGRVEYEWKTRYLHYEKLKKF